MKRILMLLLCGLCLLGAALAEPGNGADALPPFDGWEAAGDLLPALRQEEAVYSAVNGGAVMLSEIISEYTGEAMPFVRIALADVDLDGTPEAVLAFPLFGYDTGYLVLDRLEGRVTAYELVSRAMIDLKSDGTFSYSSGAMDNGFGYLALDGQAQEIVPVTWCETGKDGTAQYFMDGSPADETAFQHALKVQADVPPALWQTLLWKQPRHEEIPVI